MIKGLVLGAVTGITVFVAGLHLWQYVPVFWRIALWTLQEAGFPITIG